jgi:hypothetical protein
MGPSLEPKWTTPTLSPKYLTNDGNVIAQSQDGTIAATLDQDGNVIGQTGDFGVMYSWTKSMYLPMFLGAFSDGLLRASLTPVDYANTFAATRDGNPSHNASSVQMDLWPSLDHCTSSPGCIGHFEAIYNALDDLILRLRDPDIAALAQTQIFDKLGNDANGFKLTTQSFIKYLSSQRPQFYDALRSTYCYSAFLPPAGKNPICNNAIVSFLFAQKVSRIFQL